MLLSKICIFLVVERPNTHFQGFFKCQLLLKYISKGFQPRSLLEVREQLALLVHCYSTVCSVLARHSWAKEKMLQISKPVLHCNLNFVDTFEVQCFFLDGLYWLIYTHIHRNKNKILVNVSKLKKPTVAI